MSRKGGFSGYYVEGNGPAPDLDPVKRTVRAGLGRRIYNERWRQGISDCARVAVQRGQRVESYIAGRRQRRRSAPALWRSLAIGVALAVGPYDIIGDIEGWWNGATNWVGQGWQDIKNLVHSVVHAAVSIVAGALDLIDYAFTVTINALTSSVSWWFDNIVTPLWGWFLGAAQWATHLIDDAWNWFYAAIIAPALQLLDDAINWGIGALQWAINEAAAGLQWLVDNIISPAWHWIESAAQTVGGWIWDAIDAFYQAFIAPIVADVQQAWHLLDQLWNWAWNTAANVVAVVEQAWDWIVWFAEHSFQDLLALATGSGPHDVRDFILGEASSSNSWIEGIIDALAKEVE